MSAHSIQGDDGWSDIVYKVVIEMDERDGVSASKHSRDLWMQLAVSSMKETLS